MKALRRTFKETFGVYPTKSRWVREKERPRGFWERLWWFVSRRKARELWVLYQGNWRKWKTLAKASDRT